MLLTVQTRGARSAPLRVHSFILLPAGSSPSQAGAGKQVRRAWQGLRREGGEATCRAAGGVVAQA